MADLTYTLYDTVTFSTTGAQTLRLFQVAEGGDSSHPESVTNMRGNGSLPAEEAFSLERIGVVVESAEIATGDVDLLFDSVIEIVVGDRSMFKAPLAILADRPGFAVSTSSGSRLVITGEGYRLPTPIDIPGGTSFYVRFSQPDGASSAYKAKVLLHGTLTRP